MKFKIIWIDDSEIWVKSVQQEIEDTFNENDLEPEIEVFQQTQNALEPIEKGYVDLIMVDCNLPDVRGDEFIKNLRKQRCFAHIVFYSQDGANLEVFHEDKHFLHVTHRDDIVETIEMVADQAYRKYNHPAFMRGLLLSEFIDLENLMEDLIVQCFKSEGTYFRQSIIYKGGESFSMATKQKFISRLIKDSKENFPALNHQIDSINFSSNQFNEKIIKKRNVLAHAYPEYNEDVGNINLISAIYNVNFNKEWFHETRESIHNFKQKIRDLINLELFKIVNP